MKKILEQSPDMTIKLWLVGIIMLIIGVGSGVGLSKLKGMESSASSPCSRERAFVLGFVNQLISQYTSHGVAIPDYKMVLLEDAYANMVSICDENRMASNFINIRL